MTPAVFKTREEWRALRDTEGLRGKKVGLVPTMGALHEGHLSLVAQALVENDVVVTSIYVNPTQFNNPEDFVNYPSTFEDDCQMLEKAGCNFVFAPTYASLYPDQYQYRVTESSLSTTLEGEYRPGHFDGMLTVVLKLLNIVDADAAYFGEKDFQQLALVRGMVNALHHRTRIVACPTMREPDGLAMSSRNRRMNPAQRTLATAWAACLADTSLSTGAVRTKLEALGFRVDYIADQWGRRLGAVHIPTLDGGPDVRLIDNVPLDR